MNHRALSLLVGLAFLAAAKPAQAGECYYMMTFGAQRPNLLAAPSHTFATFVGAVDDDCPRVVDVFTISWLPQDPNGGQTWRLHPEPGRNLDLPATLRYCAEHDMQVTMWGPFQISCDLFHRAVAHRARLESGTVQYKAVDTGYRREDVSNCIHAVGDLSEETSRLRIAGPRWGNSATYFVTLQLLPWIECPGRTHDGVMGALGLNEQPIQRAELAAGNPTSARVLKSIRRLRYASEERPGR